VSDTGIGISEEQREKIFKPFVQADASTSRRFGGTGLGLSISARIVEAMNGTLSLESRMGEGSRFSFEIDAGLEAEEDAMEWEAPENGIPDFHGKKVLLVEDIEINREVAQEMLAPTGASVVSAESGKEALDLFSGGGFDLVLMDVQMPGMDGYEATRRIRALEAAKTETQDAATVEAQNLFSEEFASGEFFVHNRHTPIVAMTANAFKADIDLCLAAGMDAHVSKPVDPSTLFSVMAQFFRAREDS
jgi:CheY-like chemotaxis protein